MLLRPCSLACASFCPWIWVFAPVLIRDVPRVQINNAHLIHDHSTGRSSTRLHAPPGGGNQMGTSFGWSDAPAPVRRVLLTR